MIKRYVLILSFFVPCVTTGQSNNADIPLKNIEGKDQVKQTPAGALTPTRHQGHTHLKGGIVTEYTTPLTQSAFFRDLYGKVIGPVKSIKMGSAVLSFDRQGRLISDESTRIKERRNYSYSAKNTLPDSMNKICLEQQCKESIEYYSWNKNGIPDQFRVERDGDDYIVREKLQERVHSIRFDSKGNMIEFIEDDGQIMVSYVYGDLEQMLERSATSTGYSDVAYIRKTVWNEQGHLLERIQNNKIGKYTWRYSNYQQDSYGNWTKRDCEVEGLATCRVTQREIEYW